MHMAKKISVQMSLNFLSLFFFLLFDPIPRLNHLNQKKKFF